MATQSLQVGNAPAASGVLRVGYLPGWSGLAAAGSLTVTGTTLLGCAGGYPYGPGAASVQIGGADGNVYLATADAYVAGGSASEVYVNAGAVWNAPGHSIYVGDDPDDPVYTFTVGQVNATNYEVNGAILKGFGTIKAEVLGPGAEICAGSYPEADGNNFATLTVDGDLNASGGAVYDSILGDGGASNLLAVTGTLTLGGSFAGELDATSLATTALPPGTAFTIATAGSLSGWFSDLPLSEVSGSLYQTSTFSGSDIGLDSSTTWLLQWIPPADGAPGEIQLVSETPFTGDQFVWDGAGTTSSWAEAANWFPQGYPEWYHPRAPLPTDEVIFDGSIVPSANPYLPGNETVASMEVVNDASPNIDLHGYELAISGALAIDNGYSLDNSQLSIGSSTSGGTLQASSISVAGGGGETGSLFVSNSGVNLVDTGNLSLGDAGAASAYLSVDDWASATIDGDLILGGAPAYGGPAGEGQVYVDNATLSAGEVDTDGQAGAYVQDNGIINVSGNLNFGDSAGTTADTSLFDDEFPGSVTVGGTVSFVNAVLTGDGSFWGPSPGAASMATGDSSTMGSPTAEFDPGSDYGGPVTYIDVDGNVDVSQGFAFDVTLSPGDADADRNDSNPMVASGTVTIGGDLAYGGVLSAITDSTLLDDGSLATGQDYPLFVASDIVSSGYGSYGDEFGAFGDYDPNVGGPLPPEFTAGLPSAPDGDYWALTYVPATINSDGSYTVGSGSQVALALELDCGDGYGYGMGMMRMGGGALMTGMGDGADDSGATVLAAPDALTAAAIPSIGIKLQWTDTSDTPPTEYEIQRQTDSGSWITIRIVPAILNQWTDTTASAGHTYDYRIRALAADSTLDSDFTELADPVALA